MMTAYVTFRALRNGEINMNSPVVVSQNALNQPPTKMGFKDLAQLVQDAETDIGRLHGGVQARSRSCLIRSDNQPGRLPHGGCSARRREC